MDNVTEVTVSHSEKKQLQQFEPAETRVEVTRAVGPDDDVDEVVEEAIEYATEQAKQAMLKRYEAYVRKNMGSDE
jgi:F420-0:gamma-glutamyl ligase